MFDFARALALLAAEYPPPVCEGRNWEWDTTTTHCYRCTEHRVWVLTRAPRRCVGVSSGVLVLTALCSFRGRRSGTVSHCMAMV